MKYLLVDDYPAARGLLRDILTGPDTSFIEAANGCEAVAAFAAHHPDWVVMDIEMPEMDGLQATREIRDRHPNARVVIVTQNDADEMRGLAESAGASAFLSKDDLLSLPHLLTIS
jgi:two-component system response regulator DegU